MLDDDDDDGIGLPDDDDDDGDQDNDGDGLTDAFEVKIGTDPNSLDTDEDGYSDPEEHLNYFFADDSTDWPYVGGYPRQAIPEDLPSGVWGRLRTFLRRHRPARASPAVPSLLRQRRCRRTRGRV